MHQWSMTAYIIKFHFDILLAAIGTWVEVFSAHPFNVGLQSVCNEVEEVRRGTYPIIGTSLHTHTPPLYACAMNICMGGGGDTF